MPMSNRTTTRGLLMTALLGLSLGACSFSYSSGSSSSSSPNRSNAGKPVHRTSSGSSGKSTGKPIPRSDSGSGKSIGKADPKPTPPTRADDTVHPPTRTQPDDPAPPKRTKVAPKRTKVPPSRTPTTDDDGTVEAGTNQALPASNDIKAKTKSDNPSASGKLVAPH